MDKQINVIMIFEVIGKPPEHLTETLNNITKKINEEKDVKIKNKRLNDPVPMKNQKEFYTSFIELGVEIKGIELLSMLILKYMPAHIEIINSEMINLTNHQLNDIFNDFVRRLHEYDEIARIIQTEKHILENKLKSLNEKK
jgi:hypothetical protein